MDAQVGEDYYTSRKPEILAIFDTHAQAWRPFLVSRYGDEFTEAVLKAAREEHEALIPQIPYIGGDENNMTRHLVRSTTSLVFYKAMKTRGRTAEETGKIIYDAVVEQVSKPDAPIRRRRAESAEEGMARRREEARRSQEHRYPGDWLYEAVEGNDIEFDYGIDFLECGTQKLYHAHNADEFLPFYCFLDFVTSKATGSGLARTMTLAEGYEKCDFRYKRGRKTYPEWPPSFLKESRIY
ncbi:L-2-amino-thiazoline-4-carboxylic acid hydrolase [Candidatus Poribacteria bacterium]